MSDRILHPSEKEASAQALVLFDIDNTLINGFSIMLLADFLHQRNLITNSTYAQMQQDMLLPRNTPESYAVFAQEIVNHFYSGLEKRSTTKIAQEGRNFLPEYRRHLLPYAEELVDIMKQHGMLVAVSGAPREVFQPLADELGFEKVFLLEGEITRGIYTGRVRVNMALGQEKQKAIAQVVSGGFTRQTSFAFGDSIHDLPILSVVDNPFVIEARDQELVDLATRNQWSIVNETNIIKAVTTRITELEDLRSQS